MLFGGASLDPPAASSSPANRLPQEVVDIIVAHLTYDTPSLWACTFTSRSWYSAAVPHLHRTLTIHSTRSYTYEGRNKWPEPLRMASKFGFLPFITRVFISGKYRYGYSLSPEELDDQTQREFFALTNVRELSRFLKHPQFHPKDSTVFWAVFANAPISHPDKCNRVWSPSCVLS